ncbi:MAG: ElyC/SanA/YdcF family protein [Patescibacteria group bacterium]
MLGENIRKDWSPKEIQEDPFHLSPYSKANALAATILYLQCITDTFIFSTGYTAGKNMPSEAEAMQAYLRRIMQPMLDASIKNPHLEDFFLNRSPFNFFPNIILEQRSVNTSGNAKETARIIRGFSSDSSRGVGLLALGFHLRRADTHFKKHGVEAKLLATENILEKVLPGIKDKFMNPTMVAQEIKRENIIRKIENLPLGTTATSLVARLTRK